MVSEKNLSGENEILDIKYYGKQCYEALNVDEENPRLAIVASS
mgnify:CR=1 FL=1